MAEELVVRISLRDVFTRTFQKIRKQVHDAEADFKGLGMVAGAIAGTMIYFGKKSADAATELELLHARLQTITGSAEEAGKMVKWAIDKARETPFSVKGVVESTSLLMAFTSTLGWTADQCKEWFTLIGNLAAGMTKDLKYTTLVIGKALTGSRFALRSLRDEFGISEKLLARYGARLTKTGSIAMETTEDMEAFRNALKRLILERFGDAMARQMETAWGSTINFHDAIWRVHAAIGEHLNPIIGEMEQRMTKMLDKLESMIKADKEWTLSIIGTVTTITGLIAGIALLAAGWKTIIGIIKAVIDIFVKLRTATKILWALFLRHPFAGIIIAITGLITAFEKVYDWMLRLKREAYKYIGTTKGIVKSYQELREELRKIIAEDTEWYVKVVKANIILRKRSDWMQFLNYLNKVFITSTQDITKIIEILNKALKGQEKILKNRRKELEKKPEVPDIPAPEIKEPAKTPYEMALEKYEYTLAEMRAKREVSAQEEFKLFEKIVKEKVKTEEEKRNYDLRTFRFRETIRKMQERQEKESVQYVYERLLEEAGIQEQHYLHLQTFAEAYYQWRQQQEESIFKTMQNYCLEIEKTVHSVFVRAIEGAMTLRSAFQEIGRAIRRIIIEQIATELMKAMKISKAISKVVGFITTAIRGFFFGAPVPIPAMQKGGIVTKPTLALLGEREREAVIPLSRIHEFIPRMNITVNIHNPTIAERMDIETIVSQITEGIKRAQPRMVHLAEVIRG
jgi:hypothetical protein